MGQEIFYCGACKTLLRTRDLEKGTAVRLDDHIFCKTCAPQTAPAPKASKASDSAHQRISGTRTPRVAITPGAEPKTPIGTIVLAVGGIVLILLLGILAAGGPKPPPRREEAPPPEVAVAPAVVDTPRPEPREPRIVEPRPNPKPINREASAKKMLEDARAFLAASPDNLDGGLERTRMALMEAAGTPVELDVRRLEEDIRARLKERKTAADARVKEAVEKERFGEAIGLLEKMPDGAARLAETRLALEKSWGGVKDKLFAARKKGAAADVKALAARVEAWDVAPIRDELAKILASPVEVDPAPEVLAWRKKLSELPLPLDYAAAGKELEKLPGADKADLEALRLAGEIQREVALAASRMKPGQELRLERADGPVSGRLLRASAHEFELVTGQGRVSVPAVEITPAGWCDLLKAAPRAAQLYRALEGDPEPAPLNIAALGERLSRQLRTPAEAAARQLFFDAEAAFAVPTSRLAAAPRYAALAKDPTIFARRAKGIVDERLVASQETLLTVDDLSAGGQFVPSEALKGTATLTTAGESRDSAAQFEAELGETTRGWVYAAACCLETFALGVQAPDLMGPNPKDPKEQVSFPPGGPHVLPLKVSTASLRAKHGHPGRELKWLWVPIPLPKYASTGPRKIRLVAEREGLSIAYVWLSVGRPGPPREAELKELEKTRAAVDALQGPATVQTGTLLREVWLNIESTGVAALVSSPAFPDRPSGSNPITIFEGPTDIGDKYGTRVRGYVHPPATGDYVFFVTADDDTELWLSPDESPARRRKIATVGGSTKPRDWDDKEAAKSASVPLKAGRRYYVELLHREHAGHDHFAVGWQLPDGTMERPIAGNRLSPWTGSRTARTAFYRGINFSGPALVIDGQAWEGKDAPSVAFEANSVENAAVPLIPPVADAAKTQMIRAAIWRKEGLNVTVSAIPPGRYLVYAWFWEDNSNEIFDILLNNRVVREKYNSGAAGHWERLGPWPVDVADGKIELRTTGPADANLSGLEIWRSTR